MAPASKKMVYAHKAVHPQSVVWTVMNPAKSCQELARATRQHVWRNVNLELKAQYVLQVCDYDAYDSDCSDNDINWDSNCYNEILMFIQQ